MMSMDPNALAAAQAPVQIVITLQGGQVTLQGPIDNKLLCYGLLEIAKETIYKRALEQEQRLVQPVAAIIPRMPQNGRG